MAAGFTLAGLYHLAALAIPAFARVAYPPMYSALRHVIFVIVDSLGAWLFLRRPRWLIWPYLVLTLQVLQGHGVRAWQTLVNEHQINWIDAVTVLGVLLGLISLLLDRAHLLARQRREADEKPAKKPPASEQPKATARQKKA